MRRDGLFGEGDRMLPTLFRRLHAFSRRLIVRVLLITLWSVIAIALAKILGGVIPLGLKERIGADSVDHILSIIANSMLTVTTFSLTVMVASHQSVSSQWTPRAHQILLQDTTTHTVLATFVGAYLYALVAIIMRESQVFKGEELVILFFMTILVVLMIVVAIVRWIMHLELLGSLIETSGRIEKKSLEAYDLRCNYPTLGAHPLDEERASRLREVTSDKTGYVQQVYQDRLQDAAKEAGADIHVARPVGAFVFRGDILGWTDGGDACVESMHTNISVGSLRNYAQDPGFGLLNLTEIAQRALSPGINDPGTAVDMTGRIARVLLSNQVEPDPEIVHDRLYMPTLDRHALLRETIGAIARHGRAHPEVVLALSSTLAALSRHQDSELAAAARDLDAQIHKRIDDYVLEQVI